MSNGDILHCPLCRQGLRVPPGLAGRRLKCPACTTDFDPPAPADAGGAAGWPATVSLAPVRFGPPPPRRAELDREEPAPPGPRRRHPRDHDDHDEDDDEDEDAAPRRRRYHPRDYHRDRPRPGKVLAVAILMLIGGILNLLVTVALVLSCVGLVWPGTYLAATTGVLCIVKASGLLGSRAYRESAPTAAAILQIVCVVNLDLFNLAFGIVELVLLNDAEVRDYLRL